MGYVIIYCNNKAEKGGFLAIYKVNTGNKEVGFDAPEGSAF